MKEVKIKILINGIDPLKLTIRGGLFRKVSLDVNGKFEGFYSLTKIINRVKKILVQYFNNKIKGVE
jgi:hypothetical protein